VHFAIHAQVRQQLAGFFIVLLFLLLNLEYFYWRGAIAFECYLAVGQLFLTCLLTCWAFLARDGDHAVLLLDPEGKIGLCLLGDLLLQTEDLILKLFNIVLDFNTRKSGIISLHCLKVGS